MPQTGRSGSEYTDDPGAALYANEAPKRLEPVVGTGEDLAETVRAALTSTRPKAAVLVTLGMAGAVVLMILITAIRMPPDEAWVILHTTLTPLLIVAASAGTYYITLRR